MAAPLVRVRRNGRVLDIAARELVPGDIILLEAGSVVPADGRLIESANLRVREASLTGESQPVDKSPQALRDENAPLGDRHNMLFLGTAVTYSNFQYAYWPNIASIKPADAPQVTHHTELERSNLAVGLVADYVTREFNTKRTQRRNSGHNLNG